MAAARGRGFFILKMRPFEETHTFAEHRGHREKYIYFKEIEKILCVLCGL